MLIRVDGPRSRVKHKLKFCFCVIALLVVLCQTNIYFISQANPPAAIILVPGDGGSQAYARPRDDPSNLFLLWVNLRYFVTPGTLFTYFGYYLILHLHHPSSLVYDPKTKTTSDGDTATIEFPGWGDTATVENLDTYEHTKTEYFGPLVDKLSQLNPDFFQRNRTIRGCPYDFRRAPNENKNFNSDLKELIEQTYINSGDRVILLGHSMGVIYSLHFLQSMSNSWKKSYLRAFVATSGPLAGAVKALRIECSGDNLGVFIESPLNYRPIQRSMPSTAFLIPDERVWGPDEMLVSTPSRNYSAHDYSDLFTDINFIQAYDMRMQARSEVDALKAPTGVDELYCIYGSNVSTAERMVYSPPSYFHAGFPDQQPTVEYGNGDGTVNERSLSICQQWPNVKQLTLPQAEHLRILSDTRFIDFVTTIANAKKPISLIAGWWNSSFF
ncbi:hypothetical protein Ciccas_010225 [Cichlidogyrus casuarinus]|uniref:Uncharacterized protein n=1 Tax=Cichlidogyrus casuarinus TaxID=1844966 RepID=A0ABD2PZB8_9PLAT